MLFAEDTISGYLSSEGSLIGRLTADAEVTGTVTVFDGDYPPYTGEYEVTPTDEEQILDTTNRYMTGQVVVSPVPANYGRLSWSGNTLTVY